MGPGRNGERSPASREQLLKRDDKLRYGAKGEAREQRLSTAGGLEDGPGGDYATTRAPLAVAAAGIRGDILTRSADLQSGESQIAGGTAVYKIGGP